MEYGPSDEEDFSTGNRGVFVIHEGNFMYGNASLTYYDPISGNVQNEVFYRSNGMNLGDVAQSMSIYNGRGYLVVNNSSVIFVIDINTFKVLGTIGPFVSPRYIHFIDEYKAYVTDLYSPYISVVNPMTLEITGSIDTYGHKSTEQMVQYRNLVFTNCWSYDNKLLVIDIETDSVIDSIEVGIQPTSLVIDKNNKIWTLTDGGYDESPYGWENPSLYRIDPETRMIERQFSFSIGDYPSEICINGTMDTLYFINKSIWKMDIKDERLPIRPFVEYKGTIFYGLGIDPVTSEVYVADAVDYMQRGVIYRYSADGQEIDNFRSGIIPGAFCFK